MNLVGAVVQDLQGYRGNEVRGDDRTEDGADAGQQVPLEADRQSERAERDADRDDAVATCQPRYRIPLLRLPGEDRPDGQQYEPSE